MELFIRIVRQPKGEAPDQIRDAWIGCEIPIANDVPEGVVVCEIFSRRIIPLETLSYPVHATDAINALRANNAPGAAAWWEEHFHSHPGSRFLFFDRASCVVIQRDDDRSPNAKCNACGHEGPADEFPGSASIYHDIKCPKCDSSDIDTSELNRAIKNYGYGNDNSLHTEPKR